MSLQIFLFQNTQLFVIVFLAAGILPGQGEDTNDQGELQCNPACSDSLKCINGKCYIVIEEGKRIVMAGGPEKFAGNTGNK
ncbi:hypothetical protein DdX_13810 [Ditylenchus destructor]|uniref:Uncharacterized protein n=1 Tax=Ditylenchus destructor TaxID=166010 RepID=A0AAD4MVW0_9BILA|nr:hypothetical protein DdX_13810 [Ditylenchus destructor]